MKTKVCVLAGLFVFLGAGICVGQKKKAETKLTGPLVRMDLLKKKTGDLAVVKRDIFVPQSSFPVQAITSPAQLSGLRPDAPAAKPAENAEPQEIPLNLRYVGFIQGRSKFLALILLDNQAMSVEEGEMIGQAWKVTRIGAGDLEVRSPDEKTRTFALEGERK